MQRTLIGRGLAAVFTVAVCLAAATSPATASTHRRVVSHGNWVDPGQTVDSATPVGDGSLYVVALHGGTHATGRFSGDSSYTMVLLYDPATQASAGFARETYTATLGGIGRGHLTLSERVQVDGDGSIVVAGPVVAGDGAFKGAHGYARFTGEGPPAGGYESGAYTIWLDLSVPSA
jgi:hypothetical protein